MKKIKWRKGAGILFLGCLMSVLGFFLMVLVMEYSNFQYCTTISTTRSDAIADSTAVYAQSYDYLYNQRQAEVMSELLTAYNNTASTKYDMETVISFPADDELTVLCRTYVHTYYPQLMGKSIIYTENDTTVRSVDIYGDIFVVPESLSDHHDDMENSNLENNIVEGSGDDVSSIGG